MSPRAIRYRRALLAVMVSVSAAAGQAQTFDFDLPLGFPQPRVPQNNPMSAEKVALGRRLFYDTRLSGNQTFSCATCHKQELAFTDGLTVGIGSTGEMHPRNSMSLANVVYAPTLAWGNPLLRRLEDQIPIPMFGEAPVELGLAGLDEELIERLTADRRYRQMFAAAFPTQQEPINRTSIIYSLASFVRTIISGNSPYDRYQFGLDDNAITPSAVRGAELFFSNRLECFHCHGSFNFTPSGDDFGNPFDEVVFFNNGLYNIGGSGNYPPNNIGTKEFTGRTADMGHFKAPTLRNIGVTAPYMHDGSIATLAEVLDHYAAGGRTISDGPYAGDGSENPFKSQFLIGFTLTAQERTDIIAFLESLTDEEFLTNPELSDPFPNETPLPSTCIGDCDDSGAVAVNELVKGVNIALSNRGLEACPQFDSDDNDRVTVNELVLSVNAAVHGCDE